MAQAGDALRDYVILATEDGTDCLAVSLKSRRPFPTKLSTFDKDTVLLTFEDHELMHINLQLGRFAVSRGMLFIDAATGFPLIVLNKEGDAVFVFDYLNKERRWVNQLLSTGVVYSRTLPREEVDALEQFLDAQGAE